MRTDAEIDVILKPWTAQLQEAAIREGWDLWTATSGSQVQVQRFDDPHELPYGPETHLPSDAAAMLIVRTGMEDHHQVARNILRTHFPDEWKLVELAEPTADVSATGGDDEDNSSGPSGPGAGL